MSETAEQTHALHPVLDALFTRIGLEIPADRRDAMAAFAKALLRRLTDEDLEEYGADALFAITTSAFRFVDERGNHPSVVRVFSPPRDDGYGAAGTAILSGTVLIVMQLPVIGAGALAASETGAVALIGGLSVVISGVRSRHVGRRHRIIAIGVEFALEGGAEVHVDVGQLGKRGLGNGLSLHGLGRARRSPPRSRARPRAGGSR